MSNQNDGIKIANLDGHTSEHVVHQVAHHIKHGIDEGDIGKVGEGVTAAGTLAILSSAQVTTFVASLTGAATVTTASAALLPIGAAALIIGAGMMAWKKLRG